MGSIVHLRPCDRQASGRAYCPGRRCLPADPPFRPTALARYLGQNLEGVANLEVLSSSRTRVETGTETRFRRGDVNADGSIDLTDATALLGFLYQSGSRPPCRKSADLNDDGALNVLDAMLVFQHLFRGLNDIPAPFASCGPDPTADRLDCMSFAACR